MSLQFNNVEEDNGIIQECEHICGFAPQGISGDTARMKYFTGQVNLAYSSAHAIIFQVGGKWQFDDSNHTKYPFVESDLTSGRRDYKFTVDEQNNLILDIYKVMIKNPSGIYVEIDPVDQQNDANMQSFYDGQDTTGIPTRYDKTANGIFLDAIPNYSWRNGTEGERGLKVFINREGYKFTISDTTKMPGFNGLYHEYIPLKASYSYVRDKRLSNLPEVTRDIAIMEQKIRKSYRDRSKDEVTVLTTPIINSI